MKKFKKLKNGDLEGMTEQQQLAMQVLMSDSVNTKLESMIVLHKIASLIQREIPPKFDDVKHKVFKLVCLYSNKLYDDLTPIKEQVLERCETINDIFETIEKAKTSPCSIINCDDDEDKDTYLCCGKPCHPIEGEEEDEEEDEDCCCEVEEGCNEEEVN
jgi:hypothetical protein